MANKPKTLKIQEKDVITFDGNELFYIISDSHSSDCKAIALPDQGLTEINLYYLDRLRLATNAEILRVFGRSDKVAQLEAELAEKRGSYLGVSEYEKLAESLD